MKKTISIIAMAALCLNFCAKSQSQTKLTAQTNESQTPIIQPIQIGQKIPDLTINNIYNYKINKAKLSDFEGQLLILDFWATWCSPCVAMIPKMDSLQKAFNGKIQFLSVSYQQENEVVPFLEKLERQKKQHYDLPVVIADQQLGELFPHVHLPHYVWIDQEGIVRAITDDDDVNAETIKKVLNDKDYNLRVKKDTPLIPYDDKKPLFLENNGGLANNLKYYSIVTGYVPGLPSGYNVFAADSTNGGRIVLRNLPLTWCYNVAYGNGKEWINRNRMVFEVKDPIAFIGPVKSSEYEKWELDGNAFCFEQVIPKGQYAQSYKMMQEAFKVAFKQYTVGLEKRKVKCLVLTCFDKKRLPINTGAPYYTGPEKDGFAYQNVSPKDLIFFLNIGAMQKSPIPLVDGTSVTAQLDLHLVEEITSVASLNRSLERYGLKFIEKKAIVEILVYRDSVK